MDDYLPIHELRFSGIKDEFMDDYYPNEYELEEKNQLEDEGDKK